MTVTLTGVLADVTGHPLEVVSTVTIKAATPTPGVGGVVLTAPRRVDFTSDGAFSVDVEAGVKSWIFIEGPGWSDSVPLIASDGMIYIWQAVINALPAPFSLDDLATLKLALEAAARADAAADRAEAAMTETIAQVTGDFATNPSVDLRVSAAKWDKGELAAGSDLNETRAPGQYWSGGPTRTATIASRPPGVASVFILEVIAAGAIPTQRLWAYVDGVSIDYWERTGGASSWGTWEKRTKPWSATRIAPGADVKTLTIPGLYESPGPADTKTLKNLPPLGVEQAFVLMVTSASGVITQELTAWHHTHPVRYVRTGVPGAIGPWHRVVTEGWTRGAPVAFWGDSLVQGGDNGSLWEAGESLPEKLATYLTGSVIQRGRGGDSSSEVLVRAGVREMWAKPVGGQIPVSGGVALDVDGVKFDLRDNRGFYVTWAGVKGVMQHSADDSWSFSRTTAGDPVTITEPTLIQSDEVLVFPCTHIFLMGENDWTTTAGPGAQGTITDLTISNYVEAVEAVQADPVKHVLVAGVKVKADTVPGDQMDTWRKAVNEYLAAHYPHIYVNRYWWLQNKALDAAGIVKTQADIDAVANGVLPPSLFAGTDTTHLRKEVVAVEARDLWAPELRRRGWA